MKKIIYLTLSFLLVVSASAKAESKDWREDLQKKLIIIDKGRDDGVAFDGEIGLYLKDLQTKKTFAMNTYTPWYLASVIKVPVALELFRQVYLRKIRLTDKYSIKKSDYVDGSGEVNWLEPGQIVDIDFLVKQMLMHSDNAATDIIIRLIGRAASGQNEINDKNAEAVGLTHINDNLKALLPEENFGPITSILTVRRLVFSQFHPRAKTELSNMDYFTLKKIKEPTMKVTKLAEMLNLTVDDLQLKDLDSAYNRYYASGYNSGPLSGVVKLLEKMHLAKISSKEIPYAGLILSLMRNCKTGHKRIRVGLPKSAQFAEKTGTKHKASCDSGIITFQNKAGPRNVIVASCLRNYSDPDSRLEIFQKIGAALTAVFSDQPNSEQQDAS